MNSISKIASMIDNETLTDLEYKILCRAATIKKLTEIEQLTLNRRRREYLLALVDYGNENLLKGIQYRLAEKEET